MTKGASGFTWPAACAILVTLAAWAPLYVYVRVIRGVSIAESQAKLVPFVWFTGACLLVNGALLIYSLRKGGLGWSRFQVAMAVLGAIPFVYNLALLIWWPPQTLIGQLPV